jgi:hypothetical protein
MKKLESEDHNLPYVESWQAGEAKKKIHKKRGDQACIHVYSTLPELCDLKHDEAQITTINPKQENWVYNRIDINMNDDYWYKFIGITNLLILDWSY